MKTIPIVHCFNHNYVLPAGLFDRWREWYARFMAPQMRTMFGKRLLDVRVPFGRRIFHVQLHKESRT